MYLLRQAEARATALERTLSAYQADHPDISQYVRPHADMVEKLSETTSQLEKYRRVYGDCSALPLDVSKLVEELSKKEAELERLRLVEVYHTEVLFFLLPITGIYMLTIPFKSEKSLFAELEKLSTAWEALDRQVKNKVFDLSSLEERLSRSSVEVTNNGLTQIAGYNLLFLGRKRNPTTSFLPLCGTRKR